MSNRDEVAQITKARLLTALQSIENLVGDDFAEDLNMKLATHRLRGRTKTMAERFSTIYRIAHANNPNHSCYPLHTDWRKLNVKQG